MKHFSELSAPRCAYKVEHRLLDIVVLAVCAVIACVKSFEDMTLYGRSKLPWFQQFLMLPNGIPYTHIKNAFDSWREFAL